MYPNPNLFFHARLLFLLQFADEDGPTVDGQGDDDDDLHDDDQPTVVVLSKGDLSQAEVDQLKQGGAVDEDGEIF